MNNENSTPNKVNSNPAEWPAVTPNVVMPNTAPEAAPAPAPAETAPSAPAGAPAVAPVGFAAPPVVAPAAPAPAPAPAMPAPVQGTPAAAGDVDVIEPEWVDKAEGVIAAHINDPYGEEAAVEKLQEEYLQQRYGIKVADPNTNSTSNPGDIKPSGS